MNRAQLERFVDQPNTPAGVSFRLFPTDLRFKGEALALVGILIAGAVLRLAFLGRNSVWFDEAVVAIVAQARWQDLLSLIRFRDAHPPLYYLLIKVWVGLVGTGETALRFPSACFSLTSVALTYVLMRQVAPGRVSLTSALLVATAPFEIWSGQTARMYPLLEALVLGSTLVLVRGVERPRWLDWIVYAVTATLMVYTDYLAFLVLAAHGLWVAAYERRHLGRWLAAIVVMAILFAPWIPSFWDQAVARAPTLSHIYGDKPTYLKLIDLVGLFAFGGSLFGMPGRFYSYTSLTPLMQVLILLPYLAVLGVGIASLTHDRRRLAFLALPLAVPVGGMQLVSLATPMFLARWFSFLCPFYAMLVAEGAFAISRTIRARQDRTVALVIAGVLLINLTWLNRYYFDPAFHPFRWRAAAAAVAQEMKPDDLLLFGDEGDEIAFAYYFKGRAWTMRLLPRPVFSALQGLRARYRRVWLIIAPLADDDPLLNQTLSALGASFVQANRNWTKTNAYPRMYLFEARPSSPR